MKMTKQKAIQSNWGEYYDQVDILEEISEDPVAFSLDENLAKRIVSGERRRKPKNVSIKMDPLHVSAIKKLAAMKAIPYQTLIRHWLSEDIRKELDGSAK
jgi:predicted DNA binding CopG/RHH family protein